MSQLTKDLVLEDETVRLIVSTSAIILAAILTFIGSSIVSSKQRRAGEALRRREKRGDAIRKLHALQNELGRFVNRVESGIDSSSYVFDEDYFLTRAHQIAVIVDLDVPDLEEPTTGLIEAVHEFMNISRGISHDPGDVVGLERLPLAADTVRECRTALIDAIGVVNEKNERLA